MRSDLKSARKVAIELDIKYTTLQYWIQTGVIEPTIIGRNGRGFVYGFSKDDVNKLDSFSKERKRIRKGYWITIWYFSPPHHLFRHPAN